MDQEGKELVEVPPDLRVALAQGQDPRIRLHGAPGETAEEFRHGQVHLPVAPVDCGIHQRRIAGLCEEHVPAPQVAVEEYGTLGFHRGQPLLHPFENPVPAASGPAESPPVPGAAEETLQAGIPPELRPGAGRRIRLRQRGDVVVPIPPPPSGGGSMQEGQRPTRPLAGVDPRRSGLEPFQRQPATAAVTPFSDAQHPGHPEPALRPPCRHHVPQRLQTLGLLPEDPGRGVGAELEEGRPTVGLHPERLVDAPSAHGRGPPHPGGGGSGTQRLSDPFHHLPGKAVIPGPSGRHQAPAPAAPPSRAPFNSSRRARQDRWTIRKTSSKPPGPP